VGADYIVAKVYLQYSINFYFSLHNSSFICFPWVSVAVLYSGFSFFILYIVMFFSLCLFIRVASFN
jgi:hypothetical protein